MPFTRFHLVQDSKFTVFDRIFTDKKLHSGSQ